MSKRRKAKSEPKDEIMELSGAVQGPEGEEERPDGMPQEEEGQGQEEVDEPDTGEPEKVAAEAREEEEEEPDSDPEAEEAARREAERLEAKALRDELTGLRAKVRELRAAETQRQAPAPPSVPPTGPGADFDLSQPLATPPLEFELNDAGKIVVDPAQLQQFRSAMVQQVQQEVMQATQPDPRQQLEQVVDGAQREWIGIGEDAPQRSQMATRIRQAVDYLEKASEHHALSTGFPFRDSSMTSIVRELRNAGLLDQLQSFFPEIRDPDDFVHAFFTPGFQDDRLRMMRSYMDRNAPRKSEPVDIPDEEEPEGGASQRTESKVTPIRQKPRSMARKGTHTPSEGVAASRHRDLSEKASVNPIGMSTEEWEELDELDKRLEKQEAR